MLPSSILQFIPPLLCHIHLSPPSLLSHSKMMLMEKKKPATLFSSTTGHAGLRILTQISMGEYSNIVVKSGLKSLTTSANLSLLSSSSSAMISNIDNGGGDYYYCSFLKTCHLCNKLLSPEKDVYMYRGDQGFCSEACRSRQIMVDEAKEREAKVKRKMVVAANSTSIDCQGCETCRLLEDLRQRRRSKNLSHQKHQKPLLSIFS